MKTLKIFSATLLLFLLTTNMSLAQYGIYYGTNKSYAKKTSTPFDLMIIQPYNFDLYKNYNGSKICYLTVGEFDGTENELNSLGLSEAKVGVNTEWNSIIMNMANLKWQNYLLQKSNQLKQMGCNGMFLDTIWNDGQEAGGIEVVKKLKNNWPQSIIIPNNPHNIKKEIFNYVDGIMFENYWDFGTKSGSQDANWYNQLSQEYKQEYVDKGKKVYALSYGNPFSTNIKRQNWGLDVLNLSNIYGFELIFGNYNLNKIYSYKKGNILIKF